MKLTGIILAGGKSSRMGEDKGLMSFENQPMIQHIIDVVKPMVNDILIISNNEQYTQFGYPVYEDLIKEKGPLAGIYTGLSFSRSDKNVVLSCDVPFVNSTIINLLINNCKDFDVVIPEKNKRTHQMIGIYDKSCVNSFKNQLKKDQLKLKLAVEKMNFKTVDANQIDDKIFRNINSKNDIEA